MFERTIGCQEVRDGSCIQETVSSVDRQGSASGQASAEAGYSAAIPSRLCRDSCMSLESLEKTNVS